MFKKTKICTGVLIALGGFSAQVHAQSQTLERIEVTGSRIKSINVEAVSPVAVISDKEIKADGVRNTEALLNNLPQVFASQGANVVNGSTGTATVNLRGLGADRTLVLVNGRRMTMGSPNSVAADINQIPAGLIERIEVTTGGGSAVYGSSAVAGVVNFVLKDRFEGVQFDLNHSFFNHKQQGTAGVADLVNGRAATNPAEFKVPGNKSADGKSTDFSVLMGSNFADNKGNATLFFNFKKDDALLQSERDFSACSLSSNAKGFACGGSGTNATGRITDVKSGKVYTVADANGTVRPFNNATDQYNFGPLNYYQRPSERYGFNATAKYDLNENHKVYGEFSFHDDLTVAQIAPGGAFGSVHTVKFDNPLLSQSWRDALGLQKAGDTADIVLQRRNVEGGGRQSEFRNTSFREVVGVKGGLGNWNYDAYLIAGKVLYSQNEKNYFLSPRIDQAMDVVNNKGVAECANPAGGCVPYNPFKLGGVTQAQLDFLQTPGFRKGSTALNAMGLTVDTDLGEYGLKLPTAKNGIGLVLGFENRREALALDTDPATAAGQLSGSGGPTKGLNGSYNVKEYFGEVRIPLIEGLPMAHLLSLDGSYRRSDYSTGNKTNTYGLGLGYAPIKEVKLRASYQQAVRAPNLVELFTAQGNNLYDNDADPCAGAIDPKTGVVAGGATAAQCKNTGVSASQYGNIQDSPAGQYNYLSGGNPALKPETANSLTLGVVATPTRDLTVSLDYFDIKVKDTVGIVSPVTTLTKCLETGDSKSCSLITRDKLGTLWLLPEASIVGTNQNIGTQRTSGLDIKADYSLRMSELGLVNFSLNGTLLRTLETEEIVGDGKYDCVGLYGPNKCGTPNPKWRHKFRAGWATPWGFDVSATWRYFSGVTLQAATDQPLLKAKYNEVDKTLAAQSYLDLSFSYRATKGLTLSGGINNLLDKDPPITSQLATGGGNGNTYPSVYDALGRKIFLGASYKF